MRNSSVSSKCALFVLAMAVAGLLPSMAPCRNNSKPLLLVYKPPMRGTPAGGGRIAAAVRGKGVNGPTLIALAPNDVGAVSRQQPVIYWYISRPATGGVEFTLNDEMHQTTLVDARLPAPAKAGTYAVRLSDYKAKLSPGVVYKWFVTLQIDPSQPAKDVYSGGNIVYVKPSAEVARQLQGAGAGQLPAIYAENGFWYDAFDAASGSGKKAGQAAQPGEVKMSLLRQVGFGVPGAGKEPATLAGEEDLLRFVGR